MSTAKPRIVVVDAIRGVALLGIAVLHGVQHFDLVLEGPSAVPWLRSLNAAMASAIAFVWEGKAYAMFALLFGLSLHMQLSATGRAHEDRRVYYLLRMVVLLLFGYLHGLLYMGDILTTLALYGMVLLLLNELPTRWIALLTLLFLLRPLMVIGVVLGEQPGASMLSLGWERLEPAMQVMAHGGLLDLLRFNALEGQWVKWSFMSSSGRDFQLLGLMLAGILIGRADLFNSLAGKERALLRWGIVSAVIAVLCIALRNGVAPMLDASRAMLLADALRSYRDLAMTAAMLCGLVLLAPRLRLDRPGSPFVLQGRMSLSCYVAQGLIGAPLFYGFGFGLYQELGAIGSALVGFAIWALLAVVAAQWLRHHDQGPLESLWRKSVKALLSAGGLKRPQRSTTTVAGPPAPAAQ